MNSQMEKRRRVTERPGDADIEKDEGDASPNPFDGTARRDRRGPRPMRLIHFK